VNRFYIEWSNRNGGAIATVQNIGRGRLNRRGWEDHRKRRDHGTDGRVITDVINMPTELS